MPWCPKCGTEYREGFTECKDCHVALTEEKTAIQAEPETESETTYVGLQKPIAVYTAPTTSEAEMIVEALKRNGIDAMTRKAAFEEMRAYTGDSERYGVVVMVDAGETAQARQVIETFRADLAESELSEDELAVLAEEQAVQEPAGEPEDNASFKVLPIVLGVIGVALLLLWMISGR